MATKADAIIETAVPFQAFEKAGFAVDFITESGKSPECDSKMLNAKIMEEAAELCEATSKEDIAADAADVLYFALTKATAAVEKKEGLLDMVIPNFSFCSLLLFQLIVVHP